MGAEKLREQKIAKVSKDRVLRFVALQIEEANL